jgi:hypothetical protein
MLAALNGHTAVLRRLAALPGPALSPLQANDVSQTGRQAVPVGACFVACYAML